ncbi:MAG: NAD(P)H-hydrate dehydratase [Verrucomicrobia bacterium]|nr:NAD(P)H-hydrate dehydratase [Verrucomicrobiota bacterium]MBU4291382.1 NAD(P)H-hydrate dehydratase [Verrucomicrobiota bacterium]MBU4497425.1 NAD(P)H-hydrate dehydratase [Verrucomicrobiota bacterium]MCG2680080.1 NAD(P)H-hydrate dehydratase [Kiritimatiellia bacterium]
MKVVSTELMRELDRKTIADFQVSGEMLMDRAGFGVAHVVDSLCDRYGWDYAAILLVAGRGNNGGDAFAAARYLKKRGYEVSVWLAGSISDVQGDARAHLTKLKTAKIPLEEFPTQEDWDQLTGNLLGESGSMGVTVIVDGVLGTGIHGPAHGPAAGAIRYINALSSQSFVVAIDVPSGLDSDTGRAAGDTVTADLTVTMGLPKRGLVEPCAVNNVGRLEVADIGIPPPLIEKIESDIEFIAADDVRRIIPRRSRNAHKGSFGHVLIIGGAAGYAGAVSMAAQAALRSGAGLVSVVTVRGIAPVVAGAVLEAMVHAAPETETGSLAAASWDAWRDKMSSFSAVLAGPGLTRHPDSQTLINRILQECPVPLVLDADALNVGEGCLDDFSRRKGALVITPHPAEMGRIMGRSTADVQVDRFAAVREAAKRSRAVVVLKGAGTLVAVEGEPLQVNLTGNPGMATGGTGDVLAGLLAGLLAQGLKPFDAARAAVFLHGKAGDDAAAEKTEAGLTAGDVIDSLPYAFQQVSPR